MLYLVSENGLTAKLAINVLNENDFFDLEVGEFVELKKEILKVTEALCYLINDNPCDFEPKKHACQACPHFYKEAMKISELHWAHFKDVSDSIRKRLKLEVFEPNPQTKKLTIKWATPK